MAYSETKPLSHEELGQISDAVKALSGLSSNLSGVRISSVNLMDKEGLTLGLVTFDQHGKGSFKPHVYTRD